MTSRVAVLASGSGTNVQALLDDPIVGPNVSLVVSDMPGAYALQRASGRGVTTLVVDPADHATRADHDVALLDALRTHETDFVVLAGYMRILAADFVMAFDQRVLNVHPALLPAFPGAHAIRDALAFGVKVTGVTVHVVSVEVDDGPIVLQEPVLLLPGDDEESLRRRIQEVEHRLLPLAARMLLEGRLKVEGRRVHILDEEASE